MQQDSPPSPEASADASAANYEEVAAALAKPSPEILEAIQIIGEKLKLDADAILAGEPIQTHDTIYWISHFGQQDPFGLMLVLDAGRFLPDNRAEVMENLLQYNACTPAAVGGYYGILPHTGSIAFFVRVDAANPAEAAELLMDYVAMKVTFLQGVRNAIKARAAEVAQEGGADHGPA